jgi:serine/threonine protein phosphatase PrpC
MEITIRAGGRTDVGRTRDHNEDAILIDSALGLYIVADGMGGHAAGEIASTMAVAKVREALADKRAYLRELAGKLGSPRAREEVLLLVEDAIQHACQSVHANAQAHEERRGMGTTIVVCLVLGECAFVTHVGDSRLYLVRESAVRQITYDHTVRNELIRRGNMPLAEIDALPYKHAITRALGTYEQAQPESIALELVPGDRVVLATDGLTGYLDDRREDLTAHLERPPEEAAASLIAFANASGGRDNVSVLVLHVDGDSAIGRERSRRLTLKRELLGAIPLFSKLEDDELLRVLQPTESRSFSAGDTIVREGDPGEALFVILTGKVRVDKGGEAINVLRAGEVFGEMSLVRNRARSATVVAVEPSELLVLHRRDFEAFLRDEARLGVKILSHFVHVLAERLDSTNDELSGLRSSLLSDE